MQQLFVINLKQTRSVTKIVNYNSSGIIFSSQLLISFGEKESVTVFVTDQARNGRADGRFTSLKSVYHMYISHDI